MDARLEIIEMRSCTCCLTGASETLLTELLSHFVWMEAMVRMGTYGKNILGEALGWGCMMGCLNAYYGRMFVEHSERSGWVRMINCARTTYLDCGRGCILHNAKKDGNYSWK